MLTRLYYTSYARDDMDLAECRRLVAQAQACNAMQSIHGLLMYDARRFLQVLEGESSAVCGLFERINKDPRHSRITVIAESEVIAPLFDSWSMALLVPRQHCLEELCSLPLDQLPQRLLALANALPALRSQIDH